MAKMKNAPIVALAIAMMILLCAVVLIGDGNVAVAYAEGASTNEAQITTSAGTTTEYAKFADAVSALQDNDTLTLLSNADLEGDVTINNANITFDLGKFYLGGTSKLIIGRNGVVRLHNGTVSCRVKVNGGLNGDAVYSNDIEDYGSISGGTFNGTVNVYQFAETGNYAISLIGGTYTGIVNNYGLIGHPNHKNITLELTGTVNNYATILLGTFSGTVNNSAFISGGEFTEISTVNNQRLADSINTNICIYGGTFKGEVNNAATTVDGDTITPKIMEYTYSPGVSPVFTETSTVTNSSIIEIGDFSGTVANNHTIAGGTFKGAVTNNSGATISGGEFQGTVANSGTISGGTSTGVATITNNSDGAISNGTFSGTVTNSGTISGGTFDGSSDVTNNGTISGGTFSSTVTNSSGKTISGGTFDGSSDVTNNGTVTSGIFNGEFINNGTIQGISTNIEFQGANVTNNGAILIQGNSFNNSCTVVNYGTLDANSNQTTLSTSPCGFICDVTIDAKTGITPMVSNCRFNNTVTIKTTKCIGAGNQFIGEVKVDGLDNLGQALNDSAFGTVNAEGANYNRDAYTSTTLFSVNTIAHDHFIDLSTGLCECGYECPHVVNEGGLCSDCGYQYSAKIDFGSVVTYYKSLADALDAAENGDTLYILTDISFSSDLVIDKSITLVGNDYPNFYEIRAQLKPAEEGETAEYATLTFAEGVTVTVQAYSNIAFIANVVINGTFSYERGCMAHTRFNFDEVVSGTRLATVIGANGKVSLESNSILCNVTNFGTIEGGYFRYGLTNYGVLTGTPYAVVNGMLNTTRLSGTIINYGRITGGFLPNYNANDKIINGIDDDNPNDPIVGVIEGGRFAADVENSGTISGGTFTIVAAAFHEWDMSNRIPTVINSGTISGGTFECNVVNNGTISNGTFQVYIGTYAPKDDPTVTSVGTQTKAAIISGGMFDLAITNASYTNISNGTFKKSVKTSNSTISGGTFEDYVENTEYSEITNGTFNGSVKNTVMNSKIKGGTFNLTSLVNEGYGDIKGGTFTINGTFTNDLLGMITGGQFTLNGDFVNNSNAIQGGTFEEGAGSNVTIYNEGDYSQINGGTFTVSKVVNKKYITGGTFYVDELVNGTLNGSDGSISGAGTINGGTFYVSGELKLIGSVSGRNNSGNITYAVFNMSANAENYTNLKYCKFLKADTVESVTLKNYGKLEEVIVDVNVDNMIKNYAASGLSSVKTYAGEIQSGTYSGSVTNASGIAILGGEFSGSVTNNGTISGGTFSGAVTNSGTITGGEFSGAVTNSGEINGTLATFNNTVTNNGEIINGNFNFSLVNNSGAIISGGNFNVCTTALQNNGTIKGGTFAVAVTNNTNGTISGGTFNSAVVNNGIITSDTIAIISTYPKFTAAVTNYGKITSISASDTFSGENCSVTNYGSLGQYVDATLSSGLGGGGVTFNCPVTFESSNTVTALAIGCTFNDSVSVKVAESIGKGNQFNGTITAVGFDNLGAVLSDSAFVRDLSASIEFVSPYAVTSLTAVITVVHTHAYVDSTTGLCECGKKCDHESANESGICATCGCQLQAKVQNAVGGSKNYMRLKDAVKVLVDNDILTVYCDVTYDADITVNASCTIVLCGYKLIGDDIPSELETINSIYAKLIIASGKTVSINGTSASKGELNSSITVQNGATLILNNIKMTPDNNSLLRSEDNYVIENYGTIDVAEGQSANSFSLKGKLVNYGTIKGGEYSAVNDDNGSVNYGTIEDAVVLVALNNYGTIIGGAYSRNVANSSTVVEEVTKNGSITDGNFNGTVTNNANCVISGGLFNVSVVNNGTISGGTFDDNSAVTNNGTINGGTFSDIVTNNGTINGGTFSGIVNNGSASGETITPAIIDKSESGAKPVFSSNSTVNNNNGTIKDGEFGGKVYNFSLVENGTFNGEFNNNANGTILDGTFNLEEMTENYGTISNGTFNLANNLVNYGTISSGTFALASSADDNVIIENLGVVGGGTYSVRLVNSVRYDGAKAVWTLGEIKGGTFSKLTENCGAIISGGTFNATVSNNCENDSEGGLKKGIIKGGAYKAISNSAIISKVDSRSQPTFNGKVDNLDTIEGGIFNQTVYNTTNGVISDGQFRFDSEDDEAVVNNGTINGGVFIGSVMNFGTIENGASRPVFNGLVTNGNIIKDGVFDGEVENMQTSTGYAKIEGGIFNGLVTNYGEIYDGSFGNVVQNKGYIVGGTFGVNSSVNNERKVQFVKNNLIFKGTFNNLPTGSIHDVKDENAFANAVNSSGSILNCVFYVPVVIKGTSAEVVASIDQTTFKSIVTIDAVGVIGSGAKFDNAVSIANNSEYATSLKDTVYGNGAFFKLVDGNEVLQNADVKTLTEVFVKRHAHSVSSETGTCSCGYECPHDNHSDSGICDDCSYQLQVKLTGVNGVKYAKNLETAVGIYESSDVLTLLCDVTITKNVTFDHFVFIDLNGKSIGGNGRIITSGEDSVVVVFRNSGTTGKVNVAVKVGVQVIVEDGAFANFEATNGRLAVSGGTIDNIKVNGATFEISGGNAGTLGIWSSDANDVYISGGTFTAIELYGNLNYSDVLAPDHAYKLASDGSFINLADMNSVTSVTVFACNDHAWTDGVCDYCGNVCEHIGGTATCTEKATCTNCGHEYGEIDAHNHSALNEVKAVAATVTSTGNIAYYHCTACDKYYTDMLALHEITFAETIVQKLMPSIVEGNDGLFVKNSENGLTFKSDALKEDFIGVFVDGEEVAQDNYTLADDGTEITLGAEYLGNLASGAHTLEIRSIGGGAVSAFTIQDAPSEGLSGGAWAGIGIAIAVAVIGLMFGLMYAFKRRA